MALRLRQNATLIEMAESAALASTRFRRGAAGRCCTTDPWNGRDRRCRPMVSVASERMCVRRICRPLSTDNADKQALRAAKVFDLRLCPCSCNAGLVVPQARTAALRLSTGVPPIMPPDTGLQRHKRCSWPAAAGRWWTKRERKGGGADSLPCASW
jgi:hypothetical protein